MSSRQNHFIAGRAPTPANPTACPTGMLRKEPSLQPYCELPIYEGALVADLDYFNFFQRGNLLGQASYGLVQGLA